MPRLRTYLIDHRRIALLLAMAVLAIRLLMPTGYMPTSGAHGFTVTICTGMGSAMGARTATLPAIPDGHAPSHDHPASTAQPCAYAGLGLLATGDATAVLPHPVLLFELVAVGAALAMPRLSVRPFLRPPLRAPPARR